MKAIMERELGDYFGNMLGYAFIGAFLFLSGIFFAVDNILETSSEFNTTLGDCIYVFMLTSPLLTMRLLSEEKRSKRDQLLLTTSLSLPSIVLGKYLAALAVFAVALALTFTYPVILFVFGSPSIPLMLNGYIGFFLLGAAFIAVGVFVSAITENQLSAALGTYGCLLLFLTLDMLISQVRMSWLSGVLQWFSVFRRFEPYQFGSFSLSATVYYFVFCGVFLFLSVSVMERRRWQA